MSGQLLDFLVSLHSLFMQQHCNTMKIGSALLQNHFWAAADSFAVRRLAAMDYNDLQVWD